MSDFIDVRNEEKEAAAGILPSHGISLNLPPSAGDGRPPAVKHMSTPAYHSPIRHHRRAPSRTKPIKETLNARSHYSSSSDDGAAVHRINQYIIKQEIGRGSFGAVHLAEDQYGTEYVSSPATANELFEDAVKEFSKSRLRKRAQSNLLRRPNQARGHLAAGLGFNSPLHRLSSSDRMNQQENNSLDLIKEEIAIMKKLNHNNLVNLIEVLDDPEEDSLYMVLEMCKKGVVMKVGLEETADPYDEETCRCWFRDMILGIEYLHNQGIIHRDIKPDNCLVTCDDVLKVSDFGVSEMFEKQSDMATAKSAGSPAFMPPELCVARHGHVSGRAADIWSMGVTLYCMRYGRIPFEKHGMLELYEAIRNDELPLNDEQNGAFADLMHRVLEKNPDKRITMDELREHPWVTKGGDDPLLSKDENCADLIEPPTEAEMNDAITGNMKAVRRFKKLLLRKRPELMEGIFGRASRIVAPPLAMRPNRPRESRSTDTDDRRPLARAVTAEGVHTEVPISDDLKRLPKTSTLWPSPSRPRTSHKACSNPLATASTRAAVCKRKKKRQAPITRTRGVCTPSPPTLTPRAMRTTLSQTRYSWTSGPGRTAKASPRQEERVAMSSWNPRCGGDGCLRGRVPRRDEKILDRKGKSATMYLTRRVEGNKDIREHEAIVDHSRHGTGASGGLAGLVKKAKENANKDEEEQAEAGAAQAS
ncbi:hypothetical protein H2203_003775 [Taxawa tesnikishii (nom. ined.)]|nr:hypothetical protein H2203_003775 [Dothideales sp. JES 119]